jgi:hypothetical protein
VRADVHEFIEVLQKHHVLEPDRPCGNLKVHQNREFLGQFRRLT